MLFLMKDVFYVIKIVVEFLCFSGDLNFFGKSGVHFFTRMKTVVQQWMDFQYRDRASLVTPLNNLPNSDGVSLASPSNDLPSTDGLQSNTIRTNHGTSLAIESNDIQSSDTDTMAQQSKDFQSSGRVSQPLQS